jgi:hypothetical protein
MNYINDARHGEENRRGGGGDGLGGDGGQGKAQGMGGPHDAGAG